MKVTLIRQDNGSGKETLSICETGTLFDKMKTETKAGHITALREIIPLLVLLLNDAGYEGYYN